MARRPPYSSCPAALAKPSSFKPLAAEQIEITALNVKGNQVRIGTDAPDDITIVREGLPEGLQSEVRKVTKDTP